MVSPLLATMLAVCLVLATLAAVWLPIRASGGLPVSGRGACQLALLCVLAWCGKLVLIDRFGSSLPFWDQWIAEGWNLYRPFLAGELRVGDLFAPHNEHRIVTTRILDLALLMANGQWDARLQMAVNALVHVGALLAVGTVLWQATGRRHGTAFAAAGFALAVVPFGWSNTLAGFQVQFYFLLLFSLAALVLLVSPRSAGAVVAGSGFALAACFSMASGLLAAAACLPVLVWQLARAAGRERSRAVVHTVACGIVLGIGWYSLSGSTADESLRARDLWSFAKGFGYAVSWPFPWPFAGLVIWWPWLGGVWRRVAERRPLEPSDRVLIGLGLWVMLQAAAIAYARGGDGFRPASRYLDVLVIGLLVNLAAVLRWQPAPVRGVKFAPVWGALMLAVLLPGAIGNLLTDCVRLAGQYSAQARTVRDYLATGDSARLKGQALLGIPFWDAAELARYLQDPRIRSILAPPFNEPLVSLPGIQAEAVRFGVNDFDPFEAPFASAPAIGSYSQRGQGERSWRSQVLPGVEARWLYWEVSGYPANAARMTLQGEQGRAIEASFAENPKQRWRPLLTSAPHERWSLQLNERAHQEWVGLRGPWKLGGLSGWLHQLLAALDYLIFAAAFLFLLFWLLDRGTSPLSGSDDRLDPLA